MVRCKKGVVAQLVEHLLCTQKVSRSSRVNSKYKIVAPTDPEGIPYRPSLMKYVSKKFVSQIPAVGTFGIGRILSFASSPFGYLGYLQ
jgi:hypothetical protein